MMECMTGNEKIRAADIDRLGIIHYPDPRLREVCTPLEKVDSDVARLAEKMFSLMFPARGVGLAAPQVGVTVRLFVASPTFDAADRRVYVNPEIISLEGKQENEEGCLSLPGISCKVRRAAVVAIRATNLDGEQFEETAEELAARVFQHEMDHLNGKLLVDRMGSVARLANRKALRLLEEEFAKSAAR